MKQNRVLGYGCLILIFIFVGAIILALILGDKNPQFNSVKSTPIPENLTPVKATSLAYSYHSNEVSADETYNGKVFLVVGEISDIGKTITGAPYVILKGDERSPVIATNIDVQVIFNRSEKDKVARLARGNTIKAKVECDGLTLGNVILSDAELR